MHKKQFLLILVTASGAVTHRACPAEQGGFVTDALDVSSTAATAGLGCFEGAEATDAPKSKKCAATQSWAMTKSAVKIGYKVAKAGAILSGPAIMTLLWFNRKYQINKESGQKEQDGMLAGVLNRFDDLFLPRRVDNAGLNTAVDDLRADLDVVLACYRNRMHMVEDNGHATELSELRKQLEQLSDGCNQSLSRLQCNVARLQAENEKVVGASSAKPAAQFTEEQVQKLKEVKDDFVNFQAQLDKLKISWPGPTFGEQITQLHHRVTAIEALLKNSVTYHGKGKFSISREVVLDEGLATVTAPRTDTYRVGQFILDVRQEPS